MNGIHTFNICLFIVVFVVGVLVTAHDLIILK